MNYLIYEIYGSHDGKELVDCYYLTVATVGVVFSVVGGDVAGVVVADVGSVDDVVVEVFVAAVENKD